jgi:sugar lactone lactonase YvrE
MIGGIVSARSQRTVLIDGLKFPESPRWRGGKLWFSDMFAGCVMTVDLEGRAETIAQAEGGDWLSGLGWLPDGTMFVVAMQRQRLLRLEDGKLVDAVDLAPVTSHTTNEMIIDAHGRGYVGEVGFDVHGGAPFHSAALVLVTPDGHARVVDPDLACPNGTVITPDGRTLIVGESLADRLTAFSIRPDGSLTDKRVWAAVPGLGPDGICLDAEGCVWVASPMGGVVQRVREGGEVLERFATELMPVAPMLGGPDRRTLFICEGPPPPESFTARRGRIETMRVEVPGAGQP